MINIDRKITGYSVMKPGEQSQRQSDANFIADADRRLTITGCPIPPTASLRWAKRPILTAGNPGHTYLVNSPEGEFALFVGHVPNGTPTTGYPFEVWVNGEEAPRGLSDLARSLSIDMRSLDRGWLRKKLDTLKDTKGKAFTLTMPDGRQIKTRSAVAAFAHLVLFRCEELGAFTDEKLAETPVLNALMSKREPKTTADGSMAWYCDIDNPATGDDFILVLKESVLDNGQRRPFSVWFSGDYPASLDGLAKSLSLDMRVVEPAWLARKLQQLSDVQERRGDFFAHIPGATDGKKRSYPSTVAYITALIQHRFVQLGLLNSDGAAAIDSGVVQLSDVRQARQTGPSKPKGRDCGSCGQIETVFRLDGCDTCTACAASKCG